MRHERVTIVLLTKPCLCIGCVYLKICSNYLTVPQQKKNIMCLFRVNAPIGTVKTLYNSTTTTDIKTNSFLATMSWRVIEWDHATHFLLTFQSIWKSVLLRAVSSVPSGKREQWAERVSFALWWRTWAVARCHPQAAVKRQELAPNTDMRAQAEMPRHMSTLI